LRHAKHAHEPVSESAMFVIYARSRVPVATMVATVMMMMAIV